MFFLYLIVNNRILYLNCSNNVHILFFLSLIVNNRIIFLNCPKYHNYLKHNFNIQACKQSLCHLTLPNRVANKIAFLLLQFMYRLGRFYAVFSNTINYN